MVTLFALKLLLDPDWQQTFATLYQIMNVLSNSAIRARSSL